MHQKRNGLKEREKKILLMKVVKSSKDEEGQETEKIYYLGWEVC